MSLNIGTLVGHLGIDTTQMKQGLAEGKKKLSDFADSAGKMLAVGGAAGGALLIGGLVKAMDLQGANAKLAGQLGLTADEAAKFGKIAGKVYSDNWGDSIDDVNEAIRSITTNIGEGSDQWLQDTTESVLAMASTFGVGADDISRSVAQMLNTGMAKDSTEALDILTVGFQNGDDRAGDLLDTFTEYSTQFRKLGIDGPQAIGLISQGLQGGARDADLVADALKEFSIRAVDGSTTTAAGFQALGLDAQTMATRIGAGGDSASAALDETMDKLRLIPDPVARAQAATELFGTQAEDLGTALFDMDPSKAVQTIGDVGGAAKTMATTVGTTASGNIESFKRQLETTFVTFIGGKLLPIVTTLTGWFSSHLGPAIDGVTKFLRDHKDMALAVASVLGAVAGAIVVVVAATKAWAIIQGIFNAVMTANPVGIVVVAIAALVTGIIIAYKKVQWFHDLLDGIWAVLKTGWTVVAGVISSVWHGIIEPIWSAFASTVRNLWTTILQPAFAWIGAKWDELSAKIQLLWVTRIQPSLAALGAHLQALWANYGQKLADWWNEHWPAIAAVLQSMWENGIRPPLQALFDMLGAIVSWVQNHWPQITAVIKSMADAVGTAFSILGSIISTAWTVIQNIWLTMQIVWAAVSGAVRGQISAVSSAFSGIGNAAKAAWTALTTAWAGAVAWFTGLKTTVTNALSDAGTWLTNVGTNIVNGLISGIRGAAGYLKDQVVSIIQAAIPGPIRKFLGINSPSRLMADQVGQWIPKGIAEGINANTGVVEEAMVGLVKVPTVTIPGVNGGARGGDGATAGGRSGTFIAKQVHQDVQITAGWSEREADRFLAMQVGTA